MKFDEMKLSKELLKALDKLDYEEVLPIQEKVIPELIKGKDCIVQSKTGTGKTASYAIPSIEKIDWMINTPQILVITPTRELAKQVEHEFKTIGSYARINAISLIGQQPIKRQILSLKQKVHVVSGTIGRILDHIERNTLDLSTIHTCIIDEADECFNLGFIDDLIQIFKALPPCQKAVFSATYNDEIKQVISNYLQDPIFIRLKETTEYNTHISLNYVKVTKENKMETLFNLIHKHIPEQAIIFCNFRENVDQVFDEFYEKGYSCCMIHGGLSQSERLENMQDFKKGMFRFLIASDVASRGIDIEKVTHVYNYDPPTTTQDLIHRIGRSGRVKKKGESYTLVLDTQMKYIKRIEEDLETSFCEVSVQPAEMPKILTQANKIELKDEVIHSEKMKLYIKAGKNKKIRAKDIVGAILQDKRIQAEDIGIIEVLEVQSYVEILNNKGNMVLESLKRIKNKEVSVEIAKEIGG